MEEQMIPLRTFLESLINERDKQYDMRFRAAEIAVNAALAAQQKAVAEAFLAQQSKQTDAAIAAEKAIDKAQKAQGDYNVMHNDLQRKQERQYADTLPRSEAQVRFDGWQEKLDALRSESEKARSALALDIQGLRESRSQQGGSKEGMREVLAVIMSVVAIALTVALHFIK